MLPPPVGLEKRGGRGEERADPIRFEPGDEGRDRKCGKRVGACAIKVHTMARAVVIVTAAACWDSVIHELNQFDW